MTSQVLLLVFFFYNVLSEISRMTAKGIRFYISKVTPLTAVTRVPGTRHGRYASAAGAVVYLLLHAHGR